MYCMVPTYLATQQQNKLTQFPVCVYVGVLLSFRNSATSQREAHTNPIFSLAISAVMHYTARNVNYAMFRCIDCYLTKTELGIQFQQPALIRSLYFLILTVYLSYLDQVLLPIAVMPFIYQNKKTPKGVYAGCVGVRKIYRYVEWQWQVEQCMQRMCAGETEMFC